MNARTFQGRRSASCASGSASRLSSRCISLEYQGEDGGVFGKIATAMMPFPEKQAILVLDCAPCHTPCKVIAKANSLNVWLLYVPARLTSCCSHWMLASSLVTRQDCGEPSCPREANGTLGPPSLGCRTGRLVKEYWRANRWRIAFEQVGIGRCLRQTA